MNFIYFLKELWHRRLAVILAGVAAAVIAVLVVFNVSPSSMSLSKRDHVEARGSIEILIDSARSPIADVGRDLEPLTARAGVFARYIAGGNVIKQMAKTTGIPIKQIEVAGPAPLPGEAVGATAPPTKLLPYGIEIVQRDELPIVSVETRAPTVPEARELAAAAPAAVRGIVTSIQQQQRIPDSKKVTFSVLGPAQADLTTEALGLKAAVGIFVLLFTLGVLLIFGIPRLIAAWRAVDAEPPVQEQFGVFPHIPPALPGDPAAPPALAPAEAIAERAQLEMRRGGDV
ncbi:MAG TPA: hypothetical protein VIY71_00895 [Solirubrobacterales bacterium]